MDVSRIAWLEHFPTELAPHRRGSPKKISNLDIGFVFSNNLESLTKCSPAQPFQQENFTSGFFLAKVVTYESSEEEKTKQNSQQLEVKTAINSFARFFSFDSKQSCRTS